MSTVFITESRPLKEKDAFLNKRARLRKSVILEFIDIIEKPRDPHTFIDKPLVDCHLGHRK